MPGQDYSKLKDNKENFPPTTPQKQKEIESRKQRPFFKNVHIWVPVLVRVTITVVKHNDRSNL